MKTLLASAMLCASALTLQVSSAQTPSVHISVADLDLTTTKGIDLLYARIQKAAKNYCAAVNSLTGSRVARSDSSCVADTVANTVKSVNVPALSALHADKSGGAGRHF